MTQDTSVSSREKCLFLSHSTPHCEEQLCSSEVEDSELNFASSFRTQGDQ